MGPWLIPVLLVGVVIYLVHKSDDVATSAATGTSNGTTIDATQPMAQSIGPDNSLPAYGATRTPSPFTGLGAGGASQEYKSILFMQNPTKGRGYNAYTSQKHVGGTGLLDPLPDKGTRSKQLLTKDVVRGPGRKL